MAGFRLQGPLPKSDPRALRSLPQYLRSEELRRFDVEMCVESVDVVRPVEPDVNPPNTDAINRDEPIAGYQSDQTLPSLTLAN
jgi:hypothetical protein